MSDRPLAWVPGYTMTTAIWGELWENLPGIRHVGIDLPGHGQESATAMPSSLTGWAEHVAHRMAEAGSRDLVGLSFGSSIALQVALEFPDQVDRLILAAPTLSGRTDDNAARNKYIELAKALFRGVSGRPLADIWMAAPPDIFTGLRQHPARFERLAQMVATHSFAELRTGSMATLAQTSQTTDQLAGLRAEVLVLSGSHDMPLFRENAELIAAHAPQAFMTELPAVGHLPLLEEPEACAAHLEGFLSVHV
ncbi:alpha/beta fold hydrolase [Demetria terragena]|uniref:alpha/beta fold hydrolase n=1 Tax=Demetria terragena TaxID=63959 RepID=UPI00039F3D95|nr:alpha/beta hydrolase [Demetria terragena]